VGGYARCAGYQVYALNRRATESVTRAGGAPSLMPPTPRCWRSWPARPPQPLFCCRLQPRSTRGQGHRPGPPAATVGKASPSERPAGGGVARVLPQLGCRRSVGPLAAALPGEDAGAELRPGPEIRQALCTEELSPPQGVSGAYGPWWPRPQQLGGLARGCSS
jgi:hypothetical protein